MDDSLDAWFAREILAHEAALLRYLKRRWTSAHEVHDLRQEIYVRVYEAAARTRPLAPKSFLFTCARHLMADRARRQRVVSIEPTGDMESLNVPVDQASPEQIVNARQELRRLAEAIDLLPPRCREVVWLRKIEGLSQREVAERMSIGEKQVEKQISKGIRLLTASFRGEELADTEPAIDADVSKGEHG